VRDTVRASTLETIQPTLEEAGFILIDANDGGSDARLRTGADESRSRFDRPLQSPAMEFPSEVSVLPKLWQI